MQFIVAALFSSFLAIINAKVLPLSVKGNQILIGGKPGSLAGNSLFWSNVGWKGDRFYNRKLITWLRKDWKSDVVRAAMGVEHNGGYLEKPEENIKRVRTVVDACIANDMYVIIDWHAHYCHQKEAVAFFQKMAKIYANVTNIIYEIFNEPKNDVNWKKDVKPCLIAIIKAIRAIDSDNLIVVGTTNWSQDVDVAANDRITGFINIAYALHFYAGSYGHRQSLRKKAEIALKKNVALFVTEWGAVDVNGTSINVRETLEWYKFMKAHKLSHANWSVNDKSEKFSALKPGARSGGGWKNEDLSETGKFVRKLIRYWHK